MYGDDTFNDNDDDNGDHGADGCDYVDNDDDEDDDDDDDEQDEDDIYIMMKCVCVTKNHHFLQKNFVKN